MDCKFNTDLGLVTVNDDVIVRVAGYAALDCYGIVGMASKRSTDGIVQLMGRENLGRGVKIRTSGDQFLHPSQIYQTGQIRRRPSGCRNGAFHQRVSGHLCAAVPWFGVSGQPEWL